MRSCAAARCQMLVAMRSETSSAKAAVTRVTTQLLAVGSDEFIVLRRCLSRRALPISSASTFGRRIACGACIGRLIRTLVVKPINRLTRLLRALPV